MSKIELSEAIFKSAVRTSLDFSLQATRSNPGVLGELFSLQALLTNDAAMRHFFSLLPILNWYRDLDWGDEFVDGMSDREKLTISTIVRKAQPYISVGYSADTILRWIRETLEESALLQRNTLQ